MAGRGKWILMFIVAIVFLSVIVIAVVKNSFGDGKYDGFAKCLTEKGFKEYGAYWCPHCLEQKKLFGNSYKYIDYIECDIRGPNGNPKECDRVGIKGYPTWITGEGKFLEGPQSLEVLSKVSGCELTTG